MKELDEMEKVNSKLSAAVEEVTLEHCKKNEVMTIRSFHHQIKFLVPHFWKQSVALPVFSVRIDAIW